MIIYQYPGCSTCRKALKWLAEAGLEVDRVHIVDAPPDVATLRDLWQRSGEPLRRFFNTAGQSYRAGGFKDRLGSMTEEEKLAALAADGKLIRRPVLDAGAQVLVGYAPAAYAAVSGR